MHTNPETLSSNTRLRSRNLLWLVLGLLVVAVLYGSELANYKRGLLGTKEYYAVRDLDHHPDCTLYNGNPRELVCPIRSFNSVRLHCLTDQCTYRDPEDPDITPAVLEANRQHMMSEFGRMPVREPTYDETPK